MEADEIRRFKEEIQDRTTEITIQKINELTELWIEMFQPHLSYEHLDKITDHASAFYDDIIKETTNRKKSILAKIKELKDEKDNLKRLLNEDVTEVSEDDLPLLTIQYNLDESLKTLRQKLFDRRQKIDDYILEAEQLCEELGEERRPLKYDPLPSEEEMASYRVYLDDLSNLKCHRLKEIQTIREEIKKNLQCLEIVLLDDYDENLINGRGLMPNLSNMQKIRHLKDQYEEQYDEMVRLIHMKRGKIEKLWDKLNVDEAYRNKFAKYTDNTQTTYSILTAELERCEQIKRENIKMFIEKLRQEIVECWELCLMSEVERKRFTAFSSTSYNEDFLTLHEMELEELRNFYEENEAIFSMLKSRQELLDRMRSLENKVNDPNRFNNRGGALLQEEKERRAIDINLPKIEAKLLESVQAFNESNHKKFTVYGESLEEILLLEREKRKLDKLTKSGRKVISKTPAGTPGRSTTARTPAALSVLKNSTAKSTSRLFHLPSTSKMSTTAASASAASIKLANGKRKLPSPNVKPSVKRTLIGDFKSPAASKQTPKKVTTKPTLSATKLKMAPLDRVLKLSTKSRKSIEKAKTRLSRNKLQNAKPAIVISNVSRDQTLQDTYSYEDFENHISENHSARSSILPQRKKKMSLTVKHPAFGSHVYKRRRVLGNSVQNTMQETSQESP